MEQDDLYLIAELEDKTLQTVYEYVRNNVPRPFGLLLSGGFDSGLLAAVTKPDFVFTVRFPYGIQYDESRYADAVIDHLGLRSKTVILEPRKEDFERDAADAIKVIGEPVTHFSIVPFYMVMRLAAERMQEKGLTPHVLSGEGPDEYLGGYARQIIFDEFYKLYRIPELRNYHETIDRVLTKDSSYTEEHLVHLYGEMMGYPLEKIKDYASMFKLPLQGRIGKMDMELGVIEKFEQKLAKAAGVNLHYPYINEEYAQYCYALPDNLKIRGGVTKWAFRQICKKYLPGFMMDRAKMGGPVAPINTWLGKPELGFGKSAWLDYQNKILNENK
jgi:asparagine synthase (glutamine-hydrolysing)